MKLLSKMFNLLLIVVILCTLIAAIGSAITNKPILLTVIRSNSMYPVWERGDMVIIQNLWEKDTINIGDIIFFRAEEGSLAKEGWIAHRVMSGNYMEGFITKGDANEYTDQEDGGTGLIKHEWIAGRAIIVGGAPLVIPKMGYIPLWVEQFQSNPYILPGFAFILAVLIAFGELTSEKKRKKKNKGIELQLIYIISGLTVAIIIGATMLSSVQKISLIYEVSEHSEGVIMGSDVGVLKLGDKTTRPLSELTNGGFFTLIGTISTNDTQIETSLQKVSLSPGQQINTTYTVNANTIGSFNSTIDIGLFYPFLPSSIIFFLSEKNYWLALTAVSIVPSLPLMIYPFVDRKMRIRTLKFLRKKRKRLQNALPF